MKRAAAQAAIDEAAAEALKHAFGVLVANIIEQGAAEPARKFEFAAGYVLHAHFAATQVIAQVFKD